MGERNTLQKNNRRFGGEIMDRKATDNNLRRCLEAETVGEFIDSMVGEVFTKVIGRMETSEGPMFHLINAENGSEARLPVSQILIAGPDEDEDEDEEEMVECSACEGSGLFAKKTFNDPEIKCDECWGSGEVKA